VPNVKYSGALTYPDTLGHLDGLLWVTFTFLHIKSHIAVWTAQLAYLYAVGLTNRDSISVRIKNFSPLQNIQTGSEAHTASYSVAAGVKWQEHEADYSLPSTVGVESGWCYASTPLKCPGVVDKDNLIRPHVVNN